MAEAETVLADHHIPDDWWDTAQLTRLRALTVLDDMPRVQQAADEILAGRERPGGDAALAAAVMALAWIAWDQGQVAVALGHVRAAIVRADRGPVAGVHPRFSLATMLTTLGEFEEAAVAVAQAAEEITRSADPTYAMTPPLFLARLHLVTGELDAARVQAQLALTIGAGLDTRLLVPLALATIAQVALLRGDLHEAGEYVDRYRLEGRPPQARLGSAASAWSESRLAYCTEGHAAAMKKLDELSGGWALAQPILLVEEPAGAALLTRTGLAAGRRDLAEAVVAGAELLAVSNPGFPVIVASAAHARGLVDHDAELLRRAADGYRHPWAAASA